MKKKFLLLTAAMSMALTTVSYGAVIFSDINDVPWEGAKNYIITSANLGLMLGQENGDSTNTFRAKDNVTYSETMQLAYNILKSENQASASEARLIKWESAMEGFKIPSWAYEAVSFGLESGIITIEELEGFSETDGSSNNATREDVAIIFGRALALEYDVDNYPELDFNDNDDISYNAAPYIDLLVDLDILVGDENGNFNPNKNINRAEMSVITARSYSVIANEKIYTDGVSEDGVVQNVTENGVVKTITLLVDSEKELTLTGVEGTPTEFDDEDYDFMNISVGDRIDVRYIDSFITSVEIDSLFSEATTTGKTISGELNNITSSRIALELDNGDLAAYDLSTSAEFTINDDKATILDVLDMLNNGVDVEIIMELNGGYVTKIAAEGLEDTVEGSIIDLDDETIEINRNNSSIRVYDIDSDATIRYDGKISTIDDIRFAISQGANLLVTADLNVDRIERINVYISEDGGNDEGFISSLSEDKITLRSSEDEKESFSIASGAIISFEGRDYTIQELIEEHESGIFMVAEVSTDSRGNVTKIDAEIEDDSEGDILSISNREILIKTKNDIEIAHKLADDVVISLNDEVNEDLDFLMEVYEEGKTEAELTFNGAGDVVKITVDIDPDSYDIISGTISSMGSTSLKIRDSIIYVSEDTTVTIDGEESTYEELLERSSTHEVFGARVTVSDDLSTTISASLEQVDGELVNILKDEIIIENSGDETTYPIDSDVEITIESTNEKLSYTKFFSLWYEFNTEYYVELIFDNGVVVEILADEL